MKIFKTLTTLMLATSIWVGNASAGSEGTQNTFYGINAGINTIGDDDTGTFIGAGADYLNTTGIENAFYPAEYSFHHRSEDRAGLRADVCQDG